MNTHTYLEHLVNTLFTKNDYFYVIQHKRPDLRKWYLMDIQSTSPTAFIWVPKRRSAFRFATEHTVEEFKEYWLKHRPVEIVRVPRIHSQLD